jgi:hypothetical protein
VSDQHRPVSVYGQGADPDPRFSLANERAAEGVEAHRAGLVRAGIFIEKPSHV